MSVYVHTFRQNTHKIKINRSENSTAAVDRFAWKRSLSCQIWFSQGFAIWSFKACQVFPAVSSSDSSLMECHALSFLSVWVIQGPPCAKNIVHFKSMSAEVEVSTGKNKSHPFSLIAHGMRALDSLLLLEISQYRMSMWHWCSECLPLQTLSRDSRNSYTKRRMGGISLFLLWLSINGTRENSEIFLMCWKQIIIC